MKPILKLAIFFLIYTPAIFSSSKTHIMVEPFTMLSGSSKEHSSYSFAIQESIIADLCMIQEITVITKTDRENALKEVSLAQQGIIKENSALQLGEFAGAEKIIRGSYQVLGDKIKIIAFYVDLKTATTESSVKLRGELTQIHELQDKVVHNLLSGKKYSLTSIQNKIQKQESKSQDEKKVDLKVFDYFSKGLENLYVNNNTALHFFDKAIEVDASHDKAFMYAGYASALMGKLDKAIFYYNKAIKLFKAKDKQNTLDYAELLNLAGSARYQQGLFMDAIPFFLESQKVFEKIGQSKSTSYANVLYSLASVTLMQSDSPGARKLYLDAKKIYDAKKMSSNSGYADLMFGLGYLKILDKDYKAAKNYYLFCKDSYEKNKMQNTRNYADTLFTLGQLYVSENQKQIALDHFEKSILAYKKSGYKSEEEKVQKAIERLK
ncbi:MAG: hypothetical protein H7A25_05125 [Leptospiraceae bacterium]|nr:hypothetical protein [Leptospiraceae bacterium]MCP5499261.1 hypothetical protein [Leptospiraceae bacterium]